MELGLSVNESLLRIGKKKPRKCTFSVINGKVERTQ